MRTNQGFKVLYLLALIACSSTTKDTDVGPSEDAAGDRDSDADADADTDADADADADDTGVPPEALVDCADETIGSMVGGAASTGSTAGIGDEFEGECGSFGASDWAVQWTFPETGCYSFSTALSSFDTVLRHIGVEDLRCTGQIACNDDEDFPTIFTSYLEVDGEEGDTIVMVVDGYSTGAVGDFVLDIFPCE